MKTEIREPDYPHSRMTLYNIRLRLSRLGCQRLG